MADRSGNLGKYLHPARPREGEATSDPTAKPVKRSLKSPLPLPTTDVPLTAEERFHRSATPAPIKGYR